MRNRLCFLLFLCVSTLQAYDLSPEITDTTRLNFQYALGEYFSLDEEFYRVNYTYRSVSGDGITPVRLSSALIFPKEIYNRTNEYMAAGTRYDALGLLLHNHPTICHASEAPTLEAQMAIEGFFCVGFNAFVLSTKSLPLIIVSPDYVGFGATSDSVQAYLAADGTAQQVLDAYAAAAELLSQLDYHCGSLRVQMGYSQGGHTTIAVNRYVSVHDLPPFDMSLAGAGPYNIMGMMDALFQPNYKYRYPCALGLIVMGQNETYHLGLDYSEIFAEGLATDLPTMLNSKKFSSDEINDFIYSRCGGSSSSGVLVSDILKTSNVTPSNATFLPLFDAFSRNSLLSGWCPAAREKILLYHSKADEVVPPFCTEQLAKYLQEECGVSPDNLKVTYVEGKKHTEYGMDFFMAAKNEIQTLVDSYLAGTYVPISTGISSWQETPKLSALSGWYTIFGAKIRERPTQSGFYIHNGNKVLIIK